MSVQYDGVTCLLPVVEEGVHVCGGGCDSQRERGFPRVILLYISYMSVQYDGVTCLL